MISKVPLEHPGGGRLREADEEPRCGSKRKQVSTARYATWTRSSSSSPRCRNCRASLCASYRCEVITSIVDLLRPPDRARPSRPHGQDAGTFGQLPRELRAGE